MKFYILPVVAILFAVFTILFLFGCFGSTPEYIREKNFIDSLLSTKKFDTVRGHLLIYKTITEKTQVYYSSNWSSPSQIKKEIGNYIFFVTLSDSLKNYTNLKSQSDSIASGIFKKIMLKDTEMYHYIILQFFETRKDTIYNYLYKTEDLL